MRRLAAVVIGCVLLAVPAAAAGTASSTHPMTTTASRRMTFLRRCSAAGRQPRLSICSIRYSEEAGHHIRGCGLSHRAACSRKFRSNRIG